MNVRITSGRHTELYSGIVRLESSPMFIRLYPGDRHSGKVPIMLTRIFEHFGRPSPQIEIDDDGAWP